MLTGYVYEGIHIALRYPHLMNSGPSKKLEETPLAPALDFSVFFFSYFFFMLRKKKPLSHYRLKKISLFHLLMRRGCCWISD